ncbi:MAG TPA: hypothetical protein VFO37_03455, partial [Chitinophagaceae bacterium]|nr:hypothetical protein [Chitinophagaceae bacterium]
MKQILISASLLLIIFTSSFSQSTQDKLPAIENDYLKKSKNQKTAAWILVGVGSLSTLLGTVQVNPDYGENNNSTFLLVGGLVALGASVPLFIASAKNKKKAMSLTFKSENIRQILNSSI